MRSTGREGTPVLSVVDADGSTPNGSLIDEIVREGARRMPASALEAEVNAYIAELVDQRDENGRRRVVRNGYRRPRKVTTAAGAAEVRAPRVNDKRVDTETGERKRFSSAIPPPWCRRSPKTSEVLPLLYPHGPSSGDFVPALEQFLGSTALAVVFKLVESAQARRRAVNAPRLVALVRAGARFERGRLIERPGVIAA